LVEGTDSDTSSIVAGNLFSNDAAADTNSSIDQVTFDSVATLPVNGVITITTSLGVLTVYADNSIVGHTAGDYEYLLTTNDTTGSDVDETFIYSIAGEVFTETLTITVVDDAPIVNDVIEEVPESEEQIYNVIFMLDKSGSMNRGAETGNLASMLGPNELSRMEVARVALIALAAEFFNQSSQVTVTLMTFDNGFDDDDNENNNSAEKIGEYTNNWSFVDAINAITGGGGTNYPAAVKEIKAELEEDIANQVADNIKNVSYFISDGVSTMGPPDITGFREFVNQNGIDSYSVGIGGDLPSDLSDLNYIHNVDSMGKGNGNVDSALIVSDLSDLESQLLSTVPTDFGGSIVMSGSVVNIDFGADGGFISSITLSLKGTDYTFTFNGTDSISVSPALAVTGVDFNASRLTISSSGDNEFTLGTFCLDFADGSYTFSAPAGTAPESLVFDFTVNDGDGDSGSATATLNIVDLLLEANDDLHSIGTGEVAEGNVISGIGTDGGPSFGHIFTPFATQGGGVDNVNDDSVITEIDYKGQKN
jgi:hypothetical protein